MPAKDAKTETRELHSKAWQLGAKQKLVAFLAARHYDGNEVSVKSLDGPTQKEFFSIAGFLFRHIDPDAPPQLTNDSASIEYIVTALPHLGYHAPSKSVLQAVSSPLHWPSMLGMLDYLATAAEHCFRRPDPQDPDMVCAHLSISHGTRMQAPGPRTASARVLPESWQAQFVGLLDMRAP